MVPGRMLLLLLEEEQSRNEDPTAGCNVSCCSYAQTHQLLTSGAVCTAHRMAAVCSATATKGMTHHAAALVLGS